MGHEPAGYIVSVGEGVSDYKVGDKVAVSSQSIPLCFFAGQLLIHVVMLIFLSYSLL